MGRHGIPFILGLLILFVTCSVGCIDQLVPQEVTIGKILNNNDNYTGKAVTVSGDTIEFLDDGYVVSDGTGDIHIVSDKKPQYRESVKVTGVVRKETISVNYFTGKVNTEVLIAERSKTTLPLVVKSYCTNKIVAIPKNADIYFDGKFVGSGSTEVNVSHQVHEIQAKYKDMSSQSVLLFWKDCGSDTLVAVEQKNSPYFIYVDSATVNSPWTVQDGSSGTIIVRTVNHVRIHGYTNIPSAYNNITSSITGPVTITSNVNHFEDGTSGDLSVRVFVIESEFENQPGTYFLTINGKGEYQNVKTSGSFTIPAGQQEDIQITMDPSVFET